MEAQNKQRWFLPFVFIFILTTLPLMGESLSERIGVCCGWEDWLQVEQCGYNYVEPGLASFLKPGETDSIFEDICSRMPVVKIPCYACNSFFPSSIKLIGEEVEEQQIYEYVEKAVERAALFNIQILVLGSGKSRVIPEKYSKKKAEQQFIHIVRKMGEIAKQKNITIVIEPLQKKETNFINTVSEGLRIVKKIDHENVKLLADFYHMMLEEETPESIVKAGKYLKHCHIAEKEKRTPPGVAGDDFTPYLKALKQIGYKGRISIECSWQDKNKQLPIALKELRKQITSIGF